MLCSLYVELTPLDSLMVYRHTSCVPCTYVCVYWHHRRRRRGGHIDILTGRDSPGSVNCADILTDRILFHILASSILSSLLLISISNSLGTISTQTHVLAFDAWMFLDEADYLRPGLFMICSNQFFVNKSNLALPNANIKPTSDCSK